VKKNALAIAVIAAIVLLGFGTWYFLKSRIPGSVATESITVADISDQASALVHIADDRGFFLRNGLRLNLRNYGNGVLAIRAMKSDEAHIALAAEFPIVVEILKNEKISLIACIDKTQQVHLVARKDKGIKRASDLKGKKIGIERWSIAEFYLGRFLDLNGMSIKDVALANIDPTKPSLVLDEMAEGSIDAVVSREIMLRPIIKQLGSNYTSWPVQSAQPSWVALVSKTEWAASHPEIIKKLLKSIAEAEDYLIRHNNEARGIIQKRLSLDDSFMASNWPQHQFSLSLDQTLIVAMKDEAQWMINNNLTAAKHIPDFVNHIYTDGLKTVKPEAVNIIP
jgi:ABC-type nitrate/sulfonate/bicarbonate transport system substrate-binding protein